MKRVLPIVGAAVAIAAVIAVAVIAARAPQVREYVTYLFHPKSGRTTAPAATDAMPVSPALATTPRGDVTLDTRRQQLIGVRTAIVRRTNAAPVVRAAGTVRYDETRQKEINLKI